MIKAFEDYTLLAGSHGRRGSIWRGPDHLLVVEGSGVLFALNESYRRIDFENIQALSLVRTQRYGWLLAAFTAPLVLMAIILGAMVTFGAKAEDMAVVAAIFGLPLALIPFILLVVHLARGRTVRCTLQTAVQNLRLRPLTREAKAQRVMAEIADLCRQHQVAITTAGASQNPAAAPQPWETAPAGPRPVWNGSLAVVAAGMMVFLWGGVLVGEPLVSGAVYLLIDLFMGMAATIMAVVALVFAMRFYSPVALQALLWAASGVGLLVGFGAMVGIIATGSMLDARNGGSSSPGEAFQYVADLSLQETPGFGWAIVGLGLFMGVVGLAMLPFGARRRTAAASVTPPATPPAMLS